MDRKALIVIAAALLLFALLLLLRLNSPALAPVPSPTAIAGNNTLTDMSVVILNNSSYPNNSTGVTPSPQHPGTPLRYPTATPAPIPAPAQGQKATATQTPMKPWTPMPRASPMATAPKLTWSDTLRK